MIGTMRKISQNTITVKGAANDDHALLKIPAGKQGLTISVKGTAASATVNIGHGVGSSVEAYADSTTAVAADNSVYAGEGTEVYIIIASATATTDLTITANTW